MTVGQRGKSETTGHPAVVMLGSWPPLPGISAYCFELAHAVGHIHPVEFLGFRSMYPTFLYPGGAAPTDESFPAVDETAVYVHRTLDWFNPLGWIREGLRGRGDVLHVQFWSLPLLPVLATIMFLWRLRGRPTLLTIHNLAEHENRPMYRRGMHLLIRLSSGIVVHVSKTPAWLQEHCQRKRKGLWQIPHGTLDLYRDTEVSGAEARAKLGISLDAPVILFFGAIRPYKGLDVLLSAFSIVSKQVPTAHLIVAGRPWEDWERYQSIIDKERISTQVTLSLGYIPTNEVKWLFAAADLVVLPYNSFSAQSGVGLAGLAFRKPLLVTDAGSLPDLQPDKRFVVPAGNTQAMANILAELLADRDILARLAESSAATADRFTWTAIAQQTIAAYQELLTPTGRSTPVEVEVSGVNGCDTGTSGVEQEEIPLVSYIIITMNRSEELGVCLRKLELQDYPRKEILLVDNHSADDTVAMTRREFPDVRILALPSNEGVSGGRNRGAEAAAGSLLLFLDDDAELMREDATWQMVKYFRANPRLACVGFSIKDAMTGEQEMKSIPRVDKKVLEFDYAASYFCGAGFAVRREVFLKLGMFWEPLVYGGQELDFSYRLLDAGYEILQSQTIRVLHKSVPTARPTGQWVYFNARDRWWVAVRSLPWRNVVTTAILWWLYTAWVGFRRRQLSYFLQGFLAGLRGFPTAVRGRQRIRPSTRRQLISLKGRVLY